MEELALTAGGAAATATPVDAGRTLGQLVVAPLSAGLSRDGPRRVSRLDSLVFCLVTRSFEETGGRGIVCRAGGGVLLDPALTDVMADDGLAVIVPRRIVPALFHDRVAARAVPPSAAVTAVRRLAAALLASDVALGPVQARLAGRALGELVAAALLPLAATSAGVAPRRTASLLDRLIAYVGAHLGDTLDAAGLCAALACSRSALYRAAAPVGGVAALVTEQRLAAIHRRLSQPDERRTVATLARTHGFADPAAFSRSFKRRYGVTARAVRDQSRLVHEPAR